MVHRREGDWDCHRCGIVVFATREACPKCGTKWKSEKERKRQARKTAAKKWRKQMLKDGGWRCSQCNETNEAWRKDCVKCGAWLEDGAENDWDEPEEQSEEMDWQKEADTPEDGWKVKDEWEDKWKDDEPEETWKEKDDSVVKEEQPEDRSHRSRSPLNLQPRSPERSDAARSRERSRQRPRSPERRKRFPWSRGKPVRRTQEREGDWICTSCNKLNFAFRRWCMDCKAERVRKEGEWDCSFCGYRNDGDLRDCSRCGQAAEDEEAEAAEADADADDTAEAAEADDAAAEAEADDAEAPAEGEVMEPEDEVEEDARRCPDTAYSVPPAASSANSASSGPPASPSTARLAPASKAMPVKKPVEAQATEEENPVTQPPPRTGRPPPPGPQAAPGRDMKPDEGIKVLARLAPNFKKSWVQYCKMLRDTSDPSKLDTEFIQQFLDYVADLIEADLPPQEPLLYGAAKRPSQMQVPIRRSLAERIQKLNESGKLQKELRLEGVAKHLAKLDVERALQVLGLLDRHAKQVQNPDEFVRIQAQLEQRRQLAALDVARPPSGVRRLPLPTAKTNGATTTAADPVEPTG